MFRLGWRRNINKIKAMEPNLPAKPKVAVAIGAPPPSAELHLPHLVASGRGFIAEQILTIAFAKGIKVREDADLAELLTTLDLDTPIPPTAIMAVAEILTKVYEVNNQLPPDYVPRKRKRRRAY